MKRTPLFALLSILFFSKTAPAQCPLPGPAGDVFFENQSQVDQFPIEFPNCKEIAHDVRTGQDITHLDGLLGIESIAGNLRFYSKKLKSLHGLDSLRHVEGVLAFDSSDSLTSFEGLGNLRRVGSLLLDVYPGQKLKNFKGLEKLERIDEWFELQDGRWMESFEGLEGLRYIGKQFEAHSGAMPDMTGLESLDTVGIIVFEKMRASSLAGLENLRSATIYLTRCDSLKNLHGLEGLTACGGLWLHKNNHLESLNGLENLITLDKPNWWASNRVQFRNNPKLHDLSALDHGIVFTGGLFIENNPALAACSVEAICDRLTLAADTVSIFGNLPGCGSAAEILAGCSVATGGLIEKRGFEVFPNPVLDDGPLHVLLENNFLGAVRIELFALDGRLFSSFEKEKTAWRQLFELENLPGSGPFWVRVSDGKGSATRAALKF